MCGVIWEFNASKYVTSIGTNMMFRLISPKSSDHVNEYYNEAIVIVPPGCTKMIQN